MRIGELATRTGVSVRALRYYEERSLLTSERTASGQRTYRETAVDRVHLIQQLYAAGLASQTILELLPCVDAGISTPATLNRLAQERNRIDRQITDLITTRDRLDTVIAHANHPACQPPPGAAEHLARRHDQVDADVMLGAR